MPEWAAGRIGASIARWETRGTAGMRAGLTRLTLAVERQAKLNASDGAHRKGTPTPARPGSGPAVITGNLRRSITHTPIAETGIGLLESRVGTAAGVAPYGRYLEEGLRNGVTYPFLGPAAETVRSTVGPVIAAELNRAIR